jgi:uncharacterized membrane protein YphA (DoxX/SURF4 family)
MAQLIQLILSNVPSILLATAIVLALIPNKERSFSRRLLDWMLLLAIGISYIWGGFFHVFFPDLAASSIGWSNSPFQYEIGVADIAMGIVAVLAFWRGLDFKAAAVIYIALFSLGVVIGHIYQAVESNDYAANNFGLLLVVTVAEMILLPVLLWLAWKEEHHVR